MGNPFCHVELATDDTEKAKEFFGQLFDWTFEDVPMPEGTYNMINVGEGTAGGIMANPAPGTPSHWLSYVQVDNLAASLEKVKTLGGTVLHEATEVCETGSFGVIQDPTGAVLGLWESFEK